MCSNAIFNYKSSPTANPYVYNILSGTTMNLLALGWTIDKVACTEPINYIIELLAGGTAPAIFS